ncbi:hypothetical protein EYC84_001324 [Monilinia fructicola]|uniref:Carboxylic ester hydrolase n=1 Tax=Monilinia fructicola TaxID=38448 RepID=A0A5M9JKC9_MONFR|nr:hypothetical protein EYC84_001324 [Monilinia fructicola]
MHFSSLSSTAYLLISSVLTQHANAKSCAVVDRKANVAYTGITTSTGVETFKNIGGYFTGTVNERTAAPDGLIHASVEAGEPVIYVGMNYRLNIFGFAASEALRPNKSLNNIEAFGGDKDRVTIFGQSSGGLSVGMQILAYGGSKPVPFQSAVMESTALEPTMASNLSFNSTAGVVALAGCNTTDDQSQAAIDCLRSLSMDTLLNLAVDQQVVSYSNNDGDIYLPTVDQDFLPLKASETPRTRQICQSACDSWLDRRRCHPLCMDYHSNREHTKDFLSIIYKELKEPTFDQLLDLYPIGEFQANVTANLSAEFYRTAQIFRDIIITCPSFLFTQAMAKKYNTTNPPTYSTP